MSHHRTTRSYVHCHLEEGRTKKEILRMLKRAIAREVYRSLTQHVAVPAYPDLRRARQANNLTLTAVADHFGVWPAHISTIERGLRRDDDLAQHYRTWLATA